MVQKVCQGQSKFWSPHAIFENNRYIPICNGSSSIRVGGTFGTIDENGSLDYNQWNSEAISIWN